MNLRGKTRDQIERELANKSRSELLDVIFSLATVEQWFKPSEIAARSCMAHRRITGAHSVAVIIGALSGPGFRR